MRLSGILRFWAPKDPARKAEDLYRTALRLVQQERFREAIPVLEEAADLDPVSAPVHNVLAHACSRVAGESEGDEAALDLLMSRAADTFWKAITLHREHGGLDEKQLRTAMDLVAAVDRIGMSKSDSPAEEARRRIFTEFTGLKDAKHDWQAAGWDAVLRGSDLGDMMDRLDKPKAEAESKAVAETVGKFGISERQLRAIVQEGESKGW